jgi:hypothetical protein
MSQLGEQIIKLQSELQKSKQDQKLQSQSQQSQESVLQVMLAKM